MSINPKTIAVDFDDTLHSHTNGWREGQIDGEPLPGAKEAMQKFLDLGYEILIYSCRTSRDVMGKSNGQVFAQKKLMEGWLALHQIPYTAIYEGDGKCYAALYIDDRATRFETWDDFDKFVSQIKGPS